MKRLRSGLGAVIAGVSLVLAGGLPTGAQSAGEITVTVEPAERSVVLGESLTLSVTVTNLGAQASDPLIAHLDITTPEQSTSVDPEDWTATLNKSVGRVPAGESATVEWPIQPISGGRFAVYAVALSPGRSTLVASNVLQVDVADQRSLNPGGILPVAIAAPTIVGMLLLAQLRLSRRNPSGPPPDLSREGSTLTMGAR